MTCRANMEERGGHWVGMDVSKARFDAALIRADQRAHATPLGALATGGFARTPEGVALFLEWLDEQLPESEGRQGVRCVMEATGRYSTELTGWLVEQEPWLSPAITMPRQTTAHRKSLGLRNVTDRQAARALAVYGQERQPLAYEPLSPLEQQLRETVRYRDALVRERTAAANRAGEVSQSRFVTQNQEKRLRLLDADIERAQAEMRRLIGQSADLQRDIGLLQTVYGVGLLTAATVRTELGDLRRFDRARKLSAFAGLNPSQHESGTSVHARPRMGKNGNARVRQALYLSAMVAVQGDNDFRRTYEHLLQRGKTKMAALGALMRKMLVMMRAILISGQPYDPHWKTRGKLVHAQR